MKRQASLKVKQTAKRKNCALFGTINIMRSMVEYIDERELGRFLDPVIFITGLFVSISKHLDFFPSIVNESFLFCN